LAGLQFQEKAPKQFMTFIARTKLALSVPTFSEGVNRFSATSVEKGELRPGFSAGFSYLG
jgi:hypothetical protein